MKYTALITGASSGIGLEIARDLASRNFNLVIVARSEEKLNALKQELEKQFQIEVTVLAKDLSEEHQVKSVYDAVISKGILVTHLINNAGFGIYGNLENQETEALQRMIRLNIEAVVTMTRLFLPDMKKRNSGHILNIGSLLSFFPFPYFSAYAASKAFILSFGEALSSELSETNVKVTTYCPGQTDTSFTHPDMLKTKAYKQMAMAPAEKVAREAVEAMLNGKEVEVFGNQNRFLIQLTRFSPKFITKRINKSMASQVA